jgi:dihydroorotate dehydrogenase electron transfer subunit
VKTAFLRVVETTRLYGDTYLSWLAGRELAEGAAPGRFLMLRCADLMTGDHEGITGADLANDPLLPRAMSYYAVRNSASTRLRTGPDGRELAILYQVVGRGTAWLASREAGDLVYAWGPLGKGYSLRAAGQNLLLVAGGIGIAPLVWLAEDAVARGRNVVLIDGARSADGLFPPALLPAEVEVVAVTEDGSTGRQGRVTDVLPEYFEWADQLFACGPNPMFAALAETIRGLEGPGRTRRRKPVQALLESPMGCGTGICYGCAVLDRNGDPRLVCKEGPRFELRDVF